jgi:hypothetical protein
MPNWPPPLKPSLEVEKTLVTACRAFWLHSGGELSMIPTHKVPPHAFYVLVKTGENESGRWISPSELSGYKIYGPDLAGLADFLLHTIALEKLLDPKACQLKWGVILKQFEENGLLDKHYAQE